MAEVEERVLIAGAGPVGLTAAAFLVKQGVPVTVFEAGHELSLESRASTFHPPTLDMLSEVGTAEPLIASGLKAPFVQYRSKRDGIIGQFDFGEDGRAVEFWRHVGLRRRTINMSAMLHSPTMPKNGYVWKALHRTGTAP